MMKQLATLNFLTLLLVAANVFAADYRVEALSEAAPSDELSADVTATLSSSGVRVIRGTKTTFCDVWLCKDLAVDKEFKQTAELLYPFKPGQLIGVAKFSRRGSDYRDQDIDSGVYTLRYSQQPVDGSHVGTSLTRDFLLLLQSSVDKSPKPLDYETLTVHSAEAAGSSHPALLSMQRISEKAKSPSMRHNEEHDWWILGLEAKTKGGKKLPLEFVIYGVAAE